MTKTSGIKPREYQAVNDCIVINIGDAIYDLNRSVQKLVQMGKAGALDFAWHMSNVQTWVSTALTKESTCVDGFSDQGMEGNVKTTSNALALASRYACNKTQSCFDHQHSLIRSLLQSVSLCRSVVSVRVA
ncbi:pectinesterase inhibitor 9-like [Cornus florida]|uniref:pectinesterase inhibitor 9-like n=1 Tax=Cornus florida TaxID=4283 RepID=UPI00289F0A0D|nr:pectinesterase inhibitor 9-like [Cornus florida]